MARGGVSGIVGMIAVASTWGALAFAADPVKVAVMDQQAVMERSHAGKRALEDMKGYSTTRQKIINADDQELKDLEQSLQDPNSKLSEAAKQEKQDQFRTKLEAYQRQTKDPRITGDMAVFEKTRAFVQDRKRKGYKDE